MATSRNGAYAVGPGASVTDAQGDVYAIDAAGQVTVNGQVDETTARVDSLGFYNGAVWQKNADNLWYSKTSAAATWVDFPASGGVPMPVPAASSSNTSVGPGSAIYDAAGNVWAIDGAGQVVTDGVADQTTARVVRLDYVNGQIWHENADGNWYSKEKPSDTWTSAVTTDPVVAAQAAAQTWVGGAAGDQPGEPANWSKGQAVTPHETLTMGAGTMNLGSGDLLGNTLTIAGTGGSAATAPVVNMGDGGNLHLSFPEYATNYASVNVTGGSVTLDIAQAYPSSADVIVTADQLSSILLSSSMAFGRLTETGGTVLLNGRNSFGGTAVLLDSDLGGSGTIDVRTAQSSRGSLEVTGKVHAGVTISVSGDPGRGVFSSVVLDNAASDQGTVSLANAFLELKTPGVDSVSYKDSMLSLYQGDGVVASVKVVGVGISAVGGSNGVLSFGADAAGNIYAYDGRASPVPLTALPIHG